VGGADGARVGALVGALVGDLVAVLVGALVLLGFGVGDFVGLVVADSGIGLSAEPAQPSVLQ